jgi:hypothetical protein
MKRFFTFVVLGFMLVETPARAQSSQPSKIPTAEVKAAFLKLLDRPKVSLDAKSQEIKSNAKGLTTEKVSFAVEARPDGSMERVPALVTKPDWAKPGEKLPAVLVLHGTGGSKEGNRSWLEQLANLGFLAIAGRAANPPILLRHLLGHLADSRLSGNPARRRP